ncbi:hypothetical protein B0H16DRAFT_1427114 [Mycena metata]|uniref:Uncharacterized protein n=1 Tax=Mycena metata TaxID=1033252 RepID=A0AAD7I2J1_9AGAR|nr:hypothetical protein B0H16DRAFT_1427114 [Mycena metata]
MLNNWTRFNTKDVCNSVLAYTLDFLIDYSAWLTQANHVFSRLQITSRFEDYVLVDWVKFQITTGNIRVDAPPGYLFLCPTTGFQTELASFGWPDCPAYWSLDPSGLARLSTEQATRLGFPRFELTTKFEGLSWDTSVYAGLRQFHEAKGFNPDSQDVARHLGYPLYEPSREVNYPPSHVEQDQEDNGTDEGEINSEREDAKIGIEVKQNEDELTAKSHVNEDKGLLNVCTEPREQNTAKAHQKLAHSVSQDPNSAVPWTGINFIHHIIGGFRRDLDIHAEDVDIGPISPFLV